MDWDKVKKLIVASLCLLNVFLFALIYDNNKSYRLTAGEELAVTAVLRSNNIISYVDILKNYAPMRYIEMHPAEYDDTVLPDIFMLAPETAVRSVERDRVIYRNDAETLSIDGTEIIYRNRNAGERLASGETGEQICRELIQKINKTGCSFAYEGVTPVVTEDGLLFQFRDNFRGFTINSNYVDIYVKEDGIAWIEMMYYKPVSFVGMRREICSADEALMTVMHNIQATEGGRPAETRFITRMDIVYHNNLQARASPYYRIFVSGYGQPFLINAYENTVL